MRLPFACLALLAIIAGIGLLSVGLAAAISGEAAWSSAAAVSERDLPEGISTLDPHAGVDQVGEAMIVWEQTIGDGSSTVMISQQAAGSSAWSAPEALSAACSAAQLPDLAVAPSGAAAVVWQANVAHGSTLMGTPYVEASIHKPGASGWSSAQVISPVGQEATDPQVAIDDAGQAIVVWNHDQSSIKELDTSTWQPHTRSWSAPRALHGSQHAHGTPAVLMNDGGDTVVAWWKTSPHSSQSKTAKLTVTSRPAHAATWREVTSLGEGTQVPSPLLGQPAPPQIAINPHGDAVAVWKAVGQPERDIDLAMLNEASAKWRVESALHSGLAVEPQVAVSAQGQIVLVWLTSKEAIRTASKPLHGGHWADWHTLTRAHAAHPHLAMDESGEAIASWQTGKSIQAAERTSTWLAPATIDNDGAETPVLAAGAKGTAILAWTQPGDLTGTAKHIDLFIGAATRP